MYKVMVIDDEDNLRQALEQLLVSNGYAFCGARAWRASASWRCGSANTRCA